ncbi:MAG TPA: magnetochrome domain-containing protein [Rhodospirillaceae bacterium]|nr:magnetochrome domain-containing protein [Rhodospirillaceae bacterium]
MAQRGPIVWATIALLALIAVGLSWGKLDGPIPAATTARRAEGLLMGRLPLPMEPSILSPLERALEPPKRYKLMTIRHIPPITPGTGMPHPFVGDCVHCHLLTGGPPPGSQYKTPVGAVLENLSRVKKLGPPILPTSQQPHPPAGRCIKCHDIVVKVPVDRKAGVKWQL